jgi:hypothetical protein
LLKQTQAAVMGAVEEGSSRGLLLRVQQCHHSTLRRVEVSAVAGWFIQANASRRPLCVRRRHRRFGNITSMRMPERVSLHAQISIAPIVLLDSRTEEIAR